MDEFCTCGARLPEGARFCHKCGRPLGPEPQLEPAAPPPAVAAAPAPVSVPIPPPAIGFRNSTAVRIALITSFVTCLLFSVPLPMVLSAIWQLVLPVAGGFLSAYLYARRTGEELTVASGARMGWLTGIFCFVFITILFTIFIAVLASPTGRQIVIDNLSGRPGGAEAIEQFDRMMASPVGILFPLAMFFIALTGLPAIGGALGAKVLEKD